MFIWKCLMLLCRAEEPRFMLRFLSLECLFISFMVIEVYDQIFTLGW